MTGLEVFLAEGGKDLDDGAGSFGIRELDDGFHVENGKVGKGFGGRLATIKESVEVR